SNQTTNDGVNRNKYEVEGNLIKKSKGTNAATWTYTYNDANQLVGVQDRATDGGTLVMQATYSYDANGNRLQSDVWTSSSGTTTTTKEAFDGWKNPVDGASRPYPVVGNENWDVAADLNGSGSLTTRHVRGDGISPVLGRA